MKRPLLKIQTLIALLYLIRYIWVRPSSTESWSIEHTIGWGSEMDIFLFFRNDGIIYMMALVILLLICRLKNIEWASWISYFILINSAVHLFSHFIDLFIVELITLRILLLIVAGISLKVFKSVFLKQA